MGFLCGSLVFVDEACEDGPAFDPLLGEVGESVVGSGSVKLAAAMRPSCVVVGFVLGRDCSQMSLAEDQQSAGDLGPAVSTNLSA